MRNHIVEKIEKELTEGIGSEVQVVYLFVEIRKVIHDHDRNSRRYSNLHFFCDWVVHTKLDQNSAKKMLAYTESFYAGLDGYLHIIKQSTFFPFVMLLLLRRELYDFLRSNGLSTNLVLEQNLWERCLLFLFQVIKDCPIEARSLSILKKFCFTDYLSEDRIICEVHHVNGDVQKFISKNKWDFIEKNFKS